MTNPTQRKWYQKKRYIIPSIGAAGLIAIASVGAGSTAPTSVQGIQTVAPIVQATQVQQVASTTVQPKQVVKPTSLVNTDTSLSNDNHYTNSSGNDVHSPAYSNSVPVGASAKCGDGTYSFSQSSRGTCSHHGGVAEWL